MFLADLISKLEKRQIARNTAAPQAMEEFLMRGGFTFLSSSRPPRSSNSFSVGRALNLLLREGARPTAQLSQESCARHAFGIRLVDHVDFS